MNKENFFLYFFLQSFSYFFMSDSSYKQQLFFNSFAMRLLVWTSVLFLSGCMVGPDYQRSENDDAISINARKFSEIQYRQVDLSKWWQIFNDPLLSRFIQDARQNNADLKNALARVKEARAAMGVTSSDLFPSLNADGSLDWGKQSENVNPLATSEQTQYTLSADASWEIDLFGRIRRSMEAATADYQASQEDYHDVMITVLAETATSYLQIRSLQAQLKTSYENIRSQQAMLDLTKVRYKYGIATYLDVAQATRVVANSEADLPVIRDNLSQSITSLTVLTGQPSQTIYSRLQPVQPVPLPPEEVTVGIPAERLRQRPDIRMAERNLAAQTARIGVATADLYPSFSLTGTFGFSSLKTSNFFDSSSKVYGVGPSLSWNIFDMGKIRQQIAVQDARTEQALHTYEQTILEAIKEIEDRLKGYHEQRARMAALENSVQASRETVDMSARLYKDGLTDFQNVLDAQRSLLEAESALDVAEGNTSIQLVGLYKALAGGWPTEQERAEKVE
jgi:NodT family efflux transporter outer membrane factor (OMF) lipoprotein